MLRHTALPKAPPTPGTRPCKMRKRAFCQARIARARADVREVVGTLVRGAAWRVLRSPGLALWLPVSPYDPAKGRRQLCHAVCTLSLQKCQTECATAWKLGELGSGDGSTWLDSPKHTQLTHYPAQAMETRQVHSLLMLPVYQCSISTPWCCTLTTPLWTQPLPFQMRELTMTFINQRCTPTGSGNRGSSFRMASRSTAMSPEQTRPSPGNKAGLSQRVSRHFPVAAGRARC